jgi:hypothetical protein
MKQKRQIPIPENRMIKFVTSTEIVPLKSSWMNKLAVVTNRKYTETASPITKAPEIHRSAGRPPLKFSETLPESMSMPPDLLMAIPRQASVILALPERSRKVEKLHPA